MKLKNLLYLFLFIFGGLSFSSCSSGQYYTFSSTSGSYQATKTPDKKVAPEDRFARDREFAPAENTEYALAGSDAEGLTASNGTVMPDVTPVINMAAARTETTPETTLENKFETSFEAGQQLTAKQERMLKKLQKKTDKNQKPSEVKAVSLLIKVILALFIPPLAVFLHVGLGTQFWISLLLTLLFFLPGVIYALLVVTDTI